MGLETWTDSITGQAQYIRVPYADFNALKLPPGKEHEADFVLLAGKSRLSVLPLFVVHTKHYLRYFPHRYAHAQPFPPQYTHLIKTPQAGTVSKSLAFNPERVSQSSALDLSDSWQLTQLL
jgi:hypothetical protein